MNNFVINYIEQMDLNITFYSNYNALSSDRIPPRVNFANSVMRIDLGRLYYAITAANVFASRMSIAPHYGDDEGKRRFSTLS